MRTAANVIAGTAKIIDVPPWGGGVFSGVFVAADGTKTTYGDVYGGYVQEPGSTQWTELVTATTLPPADVEPYPGSNNGVYSDGHTCSVVIPAPSNGAVVYCTWNGYVYRRTTRGGTLKRLSGGPYKFRMEGNINRFLNTKAAVDPQNPDVAMFGTNENKIVYTLNGTSAIPTTSTIAVTNTSTLEGTTPSIFVAVDPNSAVVGGVKQRWAYHIWDDGTYLSTTGPAGTYTKLTGPTQLTEIQFSLDGTLYGLAKGANGNLYKMASGATTLTRVSSLPNGGNDPSYGSLCLDPLNASNIVMIDLTSAYRIIRSSDAGGTWTAVWQLGDINSYATNSRWVGKINGSGSGGKLFWDYSGKIHVATGFNLYESTPVASPATKWIWRENGKGLREFEISNVHWVSGSYAPQASLHDRGACELLPNSKTRDVGRNSYGNGRAMYPMGIAQNSSAWMVDTVPGFPKRWLQTCSFFRNDHGWYDEDTGVWTGFDAAWHDITDGYPYKTAVFQASISGTTLTLSSVTSVAAGAVAVAGQVYSAGQPVTVQRLLTGTQDAPGSTYEVIGAHTGYGAPALSQTVPLGTMFTVNTYFGGQHCASSLTTHYHIPSNNASAFKTTNNGKSYSYWRLPGMSAKTGIVWGSGTSAITITSVDDYDETGNQNFNIVIAAAGTASVAYNSGTKTITVTPATGASNANAIAAQINASANSNTRILAVGGGAGAVSPASFQITYDSGFGWFFWHPGRFACSTKTAGTKLGDLLVYTYGQSYALGPRGYWRVPADGSTPTKLWSGFPYSNIPGSVGVRLLDVPGNPTHWFTATDFASPLMYTSNDGPNLAAVPNTSNVAAVGFTAPAPGQTYPGVVFYGTLSSQVGLYIIDDMVGVMAGTKTPRFLVDYPGGCLDNILWIVGDPDHYGQGYVAYNHSGVRWFEVRDQKTLT